MQLHGQTVINLFHFATTVNVASPTGENDINSRFNTTIVPAYQPCVSQDLKFINVTTRPLTRPAATPVVWNFAPGTQGSIASLALPTTTAGIIYIRTAFRSQTGRGRIFVPGLPASSVLSSQLTPGAITALQNFCANTYVNFVGAVSTQTFVAYLVSRKGSNLRAGTVAGGNIAQTFPQLNIGTNRRRKLGRGI
jgi:hypothetical protein